jgi:hypothetical protein
MQIRLKVPLYGILNKELHALVKILILKLKLVNGKARRFYLVHFRKDYVQRKLLLRRGKCQQCGCCCSLLFTCLMLTQEGLCRVYERNRWLACKVFPIDERDIADVALQGGKCGYYFERETNFGL